MSYPERIVPDETEPGIVALHVVRYRFALPHCVDREVLDAACGVGYGSTFLAEAARHVVGVDIDEGSIAYARGRYAAPNAEFVVGDVLDLPFSDDSFDVVCCFEAIEHISEQERLVVELARVLRPDGVLVASTPRVDRTDRSPANPFHAVELSQTDFEALLRTRFEEVELFGQRRLETTRHRLARRADVFGLRRRVPMLRRIAGATTGTAATDRVTVADVVIASDRLDEATELVAVACGPR